MQASERQDLLARSGRSQGYSLVQTLFLSRLQQLIARRQKSAGLLGADDWRLRLLDKALYSTYQDCVDLDVGEQARNLLRPLRQPPGTQR